MNVLFKITSNKRTVYKYRSCRFSYIFSNKKDFKKFVFHRSKDLESLIDFLFVNYNILLCSACEIQDLKIDVIQSILFSLEKDSDSYFIETKLLKVLDLSILILDRSNKKRLCNRFCDIRNRLFLSPISVFTLGSYIVKKS